MTHHAQDTAGAEMNLYWRAQQAAQQKPAIDVHHDVTTAGKQQVIHSDTKKPTGETPEECAKCSISKKCKIILKLWYQHAPRPQLVRAWVQLVDEHAADMPCLSALREA